MKRCELACYMLIASAIITTSLICVRASGMLDSRAQAEMAVHKDVLTVISTRFRNDTEIIYVLDSKSERLLAYLYDPNNKVIDLMPGGSMDVADAFNRTMRPAVGGVRGTRPQPR